MRNIGLVLKSNSKSLLKILIKLLLGLCKKIISSKMMWCRTTSLIINFSIFQNWTRQPMNLSVGPPLLLILD
jgi:hypothetical protein